MLGKRFRISLNVPLMSGGGRGRRLRATCRDGHDQTVPQPVVTTVSFQVVQDIEGSNWALLRGRPIVVIVLAGAAFETIAKSIGHDE